MMFFRSVLAASAVAVGASTSAEAQVPLSKVMPRPQVPGKSLPMAAEARGTGWTLATSSPWPNVAQVARESARTGRDFASSGIDTVILRAAEAEAAEVAEGPAGSPVRVSGVAESSVEGYHPAAPEPSGMYVAPPTTLGLDFASRSFGKTLVISSSHEARYIHHDHKLAGLRVVVPPGVKVVKQPRELTDANAKTPDLAPPDERRAGSAGESSSAAP